MIRVPVCGSEFAGRSVPDTVALTGPPRRHTLIACGSCFIALDLSHSARVNVQRLIRGNHGQSILAGPTSSLHLGLMPAWSYVWTSQPSTGLVDAIRYSTSHGWNGRWIFECLPAEVFITTIMVEDGQPSLAVIAAGSMGGRSEIKDEVRRNHERL
jgi:hypothetical protein